MNHNHRTQPLLLANASQSREIDRQTIESLGLPGETLMEIAGFGAAGIIGGDFPHGGSVLFVCGKGNNAGDAFVAARILLDRGFAITIFPVFGTDDLSGDAGRNYQRLMGLAESMDTGVDVWSKWRDPSDYDLVVDGIFGTGLQREVKDPVTGVIQKINQCMKPVYALDIPSGLHCDSGEVLGTAVHASKTLQFGLRKLGCHLGSGPALSGERTLIPLPFPNVYKKAVTIRLVDEAYDPDADLGDVRPTGRSNLHKYSNGVVHVIGGSTGLTGAPLYAGRAAWALGMGAVQLIHPHGWLSAMDLHAPELIKKPVGPAGAESFTSDDIDTTLSIINEREGVTVIGPGIGRNPGTMEFVRGVIGRSEGPIIVDADGLRALHGSFKTITDRKHPELVILTPHPGELAFLAGESFDNDFERMKLTSRVARHTGCTVLAKGNPVLVHASPENQTLLTGYDTSGFARAGFGDILAGHISAFLARGNTSLRSCENGLLHGHIKLSQIAAQGTRFPEPYDLI